nr:MAG TPA: tail fiber protein [Caudoviricetes sp.]
MKAVLDAVGGAYIVDQGQVPYEKQNDADTPIYYRKWSNGFIEQWHGREFSNNGVEITFPIPFSNTDYVLTGVGYWLQDIASLTFTKKTTGFTTVYSTRLANSYGWYACGY